MRIPSLVVVVVAVSQMGATDCGNVITDPGFDLWCGQDLCKWKTERGEIRSVPTWNEADPGVELVGDDVAIEQFTDVNSQDGDCIKFDMLVDVELGAEVQLNVDVFGDGSVEHTETIPTSNWAPLSFILPINGVYDGIRFEIAKTGNGRAVIAQIGAQTTTGEQCANPSIAITPAPAPLGEVCLYDSGCASNNCPFRTCAPCTATSCASGLTCGTSGNCD
jgi:hypothetical protein